MSKKAKILFIHHGTGIGGAPINLLYLILNLKQAGYHCKVGLIKGGAAEILFSRNNIEYDVIGSSNVYFLHTATMKPRLFNVIKLIKIFYHWLLSAFKQAPEYLKKNKEFDIVHLGSHGLTSWAFAAKRLGFKTIIHNQETVSDAPFDFRRSLLQSLINKYTDKVIDISYFNKTKLGIHSSEVVYNFIEIPPQYRPSMQNSTTSIKVLYLGGQTLIKGFETAVNCLPHLAPGISLQFGGNLGSIKKGHTLKDQLKHLVKFYLFRKTYKPLKKITDAPNVEVIGLLEDPLPFIDNCDILITPFKVEHFSRPAMEALAYGKPVIGSNVEGMDEIIDHNVNGLLIKKNDPKALAEAINYLCQNPDVARKMGEKGREKAISLFSPSKNTAKVAALYDELMNPK